MPQLEAIGNIIGSVLGLIICLVLNRYYKGIGNDSGKIKCNGCGKYFSLREMLGDKRMCKDCYIKWLETDFVKMRTEQLEAQIEKMKCCENCAFFKDKTYDICHKIKKLGTRKCAFYKML